MCLLNRHWIKRFILLALIFFASEIDAQRRPVSISDSEFGVIVQVLSEQGGNFHSDNWVSNEQSYLEVIDSIDRNLKKGGVYIGVGPEQNFAYISAIKPELAFIVDIRKQNRLQHLVYKALFILSETRLDFLSYLFSVPYDREKAPKMRADVVDLVSYFEKMTYSHELQKHSEEQVFDLLENRYNVQFSKQDSLVVRKIFSAFSKYRFNITYQGERRYRWASLRELLMIPIPETGEPGTLFNNEYDYRYIREMHRQNRIIPVTGDFGGDYAINAIGDFLRENSLMLTAFYVSNVEQYLLRSYSGWYNWAENLRSLPIDENSAIIRWTYERRTFFQETRLQRINIFLRNFDQEKYRSYEDLRRYDYLK